MDNWNLGNAEHNCMDQEFLGLNMARYSLIVVNADGIRLKEYEAHDSSRKLLFKRKREVEKELKREFPNDSFQVKIKHDAIIKGKVTSSYL